MTYEATPSATSSPESGDGVTPCDSQDGPMTDLFGQEVAHASRSAPQASSVAAMMNDICGPTSFDLFGPVDRGLSSGSKSPVEPVTSGLMVKERTCRTCKTALPYSEFYVNSKGNRRNSCKACVTATERQRKRSEPDVVSDRYKAWRLERRGFALTNVAKNRAKVRGLPFDLDPQEIQAVIDAGRCQVTGIEFDLSEPRAWNAPSLDQIKPGRGYTKDNVRVVLYALNVMANTWGTQRISQIASAISDRQRERSERFSSLIAERLKEVTTMRDSPLFGFSWKKKATPSGRSIFLLRASGLLTSDSGCSGWLTPRARADAGGKRWRDRLAKNLEDQARIYALMRGLPDTEVARLSLSATFVRRLMGYLAVWDDCAPTAMRSSRKSRQHS